MSPVEKSSHRFFLTVWLIGWLLLGFSTAAWASASTYSETATSAISHPDSGGFVPFLAQEESTEIDRTKRMTLVGAACFGVIGTIIILFGYFRLDHATRGFYSGRLQTLAFFLIIVLLGAAIWVAQKFGL